MADETNAQATPAKARAAQDTVLVRLTSAGPNDKFVIGEGDQEMAITPQGVEIAQSRVEDLLEVAAYNQVALTVEPVEKGK